MTRWAKVSTDVLAALTPHELRVYVALAIHRNNESGEAWPEVQTLCDVVGVRKSVLYKHLKSIEDKGLIERLPERGRRLYLVHLSAPAGKPIPLPAEMDSAPSGKSVVDTSIEQTKNRGTKTASTNTREESNKARFRAMLDERPEQYGGKTCEEYIRAEFVSLDGLNGRPSAAQAILNAYDHWSTKPPMWRKGSQIVENVRMQANRYRPAYEQDRRFDRLGYATAADRREAEETYEQRMRRLEAEDDARRSGEP